MARSLSQLFYAMGGSVSAGKSNDELIDHLVDAEFIRTPGVQRVFRAVDRGNYYHPSHKQNAYRDIAWKMGNLHLSAPCVYSVVMESLKLNSGLSFLNLGSGSGYLSTMAGLILGRYGTNHGIEFHDDIVDYAYDRLDDFLKKSKIVDECDFCEPIFTVGNCLTLDSTSQQYDRVYCGAACPEEYESYVKNLVKVDGILVMPLNDKLLKITRVDETTWSTAKILSVSFAPLIPPPNKKETEVEPAKLGDIKPPKLQQLCRFRIRSILRRNVRLEHPKLESNKMVEDFQGMNPVQCLVIKCFEDSDDSDADNENVEYLGPELSPLPNVFSQVMFADDPPDDDGNSSDSSLKNFTSKENVEDCSLKMVNQNPPNATTTSTESNNTNQNNENKTSATSESGSMNSVTNVSNSNKESDPNFSLPPSQSTRSKKRLLEQKESNLEHGPGTSSSQRKRIKVEHIRSNHHFKHLIKLNAENKIIKDFSYTYFLTHKIASLPLPGYLLQYVNYKRDNF